MDAAIEAGAQDVESDEETHTIFTAFEDLNAVVEGLQPVLGDPKSTSIVWRPKSGVPVSGDAVATLMKLMDALDDDDDVQAVFANFEMSDEDMERLAD
jgi:transcriptional/translational regulatory protein YebC/TACO1